MDLGAQAQLASHLANREQTPLTNLEWDLTAFYCISSAGRVHRLYPTCIQKGSRQIVSLSSKSSHEKQSEYNEINMNGSLMYDKFNYG